MELKLEDLHHSPYMYMPILTCQLNNNEAQGQIGLLKKPPTDA